MLAIAKKYRCYFFTIFFSIVPLKAKRIGMCQISSSEKRQVCNMFQEPLEQPILGFRIEEEKQDRLNIIKILTKRWTES